MEPIHTPVDDPLGTGTKYQVDKTQSTRLRYESLTKNEGKTSSKVEPNTEPLKLQTCANIQAFLLSDDELDKESDKEEVLATGDDMDEVPKDDAEVRTPSPDPTQPEPSHVQESASDSSSQLLRNNRNREAAVSYADLKASIDQYYDENITHRDQTDKLIEASVSSLDRSSTTISDLYKGLDVITQLLKDINTAMKDDPATNQKLNEATETFARISSNITENLGSWMSEVELSQTDLKREISSLKKDTSKIKSMMTEMYAAFQANVEGENANTTATEEPPSHTKGETEEPILIDKGKWIATESDDDPSKKQVKASFIVRPDPDEPVRKAEEETRLIAMTKLEVIKVVQEEAEKIGLDPKAIKGAKAGEMFKKAQDAEHVVLKRQHTEKVRKSLELRKHKYDSYMWTVSSRLKPEPITDIKIHPKTKPVVITVYRGTDGRNFEVHEPFLFGAFGISELDELREIIPKKKNAVPHPDPEEGNESTWNLSLKQESLDWNAIELSLKMDQAFQRWSDIDKVGMEALMLYLVAASMVKSFENARFSRKPRKLIAEHPDQEKLKSNKVKLEALGYKMD
ncbi:hypothetical protein Tco_1554622 [Tanacetum coccineum]